MTHDELLVVEQRLCAARPYYAPELQEVLSSIPWWSSAVMDDIWGNIAGFF